MLGVKTPNTKCAPLTFTLKYLQVYQDQLDK